MKKLAITLLFLSQINCVYSLEINELIEPRNLKGPVDNLDRVEAIKENKIDNKIIEKAKIIPKKEEMTLSEINQIKESLKKEKNVEVETAKTISSNYADLSLKRLADDVSYELEMDSSKINADLNILWNCVTQNSQTLKYTIYKLANPDEDKPNDSLIKKIIKPIANFGSMAGASVAGDPFVATGALIGGGLVNAFMKDDKEYNYKFSKVSDADMVLLIRKIDDLQKKLLDLYVDYRTKQQLAILTQKNCEKREEIYKNSQNKSKEELIIADVYYRNAKVSAQRAQDDYITSRAILENLVGVEALKKIED